VQAPGPPGAFTQRDSGATTILTRDSVALDSHWPRRLEARRFDDIADEEIALERGEIDVGLFWPGELSTRMRKDSRWARFLGTWKHGLVAMEWTGSPDAGLQDYAQDVLRTLCRETLRGDMWQFDTVRPSPPPPESLGSVQLEIDPGCPGHAELQRALNRAAPVKPAGHPSHRARLLYLDESRMRIQFGPVGGRVTPLFLVDCLVVCAAEVRPKLYAESADGLVNLIQCDHQGAEP
jgi:hypothetical protein